MALNDADDANLLLGIANARLNKLPEAKTAFDAVKNPALADVAGLWKLKLDVSGAPAESATGTGRPADDRLTPEATRREDEPRGRESAGLLLPAHAALVTGLLPKRDASSIKCP